ncbi:MAG: hypothetical protein ACREBS_03215 [Nitrososphaerales archaeon]
MKAKSKSDVRIAGILFALSGTPMILIISLPDALYPDYSVHKNAISNLGCDNSQNYRNG